MEKPQPLFLGYQVSAYSDYNTEIIEVIDVYPARFDTIECSYVICEPSQAQYNLARCMTYGDVMVTILFTKDCKGVELLADLL